MKKRSEWIEVNEVIKKVEFYSKYRVGSPAYMADLKREVFKLELEPSLDEPIEELDTLFSVPKWLVAYK